MVIMLITDLPFDVSPLEERYRPEDEMAELLRGETVSNSLDCHNEEVGSENWQVVNSR